MPRAEVALDVTPVAVETGVTIRTKSLAHVSVHAGNGTRACTNRVHLTRQAFELSPYCSSSALGTLRP